MERPSVHPLPGIPQRVEIWEVGPRDGLQNESAVVATGTKVELIGRLAAAGLSVVEATSFVHPEWVPQLADAEDVLARIDRSRETRFPVLVPNETGYGRALEAGATEIAVFASATESFARRNLNRSLNQQYEMFTAVVERALDDQIPVRAYVSMCFGDPWEGAVSVRQVVDVARRLLDMGCGQIALGDTIGVATTGHVVALVETLAGEGIGPEQLAVHFHDTYGQALANTVTALRCGITTVDASVGGLGGCPYADSATGNLATEDLVWLLHGLGVETGVDLDALVQTSTWMAAQLGKPSPSRVVQAMAGR